MAEPLLSAPPHWERTTLEPQPLLGFIERVSSGGTPSTANPDYWDGDIPWLTPKDITGKDASLYVSHTSRCITDRGLANSGATLLASGTVMLTKRAPVGAVAVNTVPMATNQGFLNFGCGPKLRPLFLAYWMLVNTRYLQQVANGSTYLELYKSDLFEFEVAVPPLKEQESILQAIRAVEFAVQLGEPLGQSVTEPSLTRQVHDQTRTLIGMRKRFLIKLLSGQLHPTLRPNVAQSIGPLLT